MQTEVVMPQMGESVAEGTVTEWLKEVGDYVERDEPLFLITTDKVDADVPCPKEGTLVEKRVEPILWPIGLAQVLASQKCTSLSSCWHDEFGMIRKEGRKEGLQSCICHRGQFS